MPNRRIEMCILNRNIYTTLLDDKNSHALILFLNGSILNRHVFIAYIYAIFDGNFRVRKKLGGWRGS